MLKRIGLVLALLAAVVGQAAAQASGTTSFRIAYSYDLDSADPTFTYPLLQPLRNGVARIKTTGSSATIDAASGTPFDDTAVGSILAVRTTTSDAQDTIRTIIAKASGAQVTVDAVVDWSGNGATGFTFTYQNLTDGTGLGAGWFGVSGYTSRTVYFGVLQQNTTTGSTVRIECKSPGGDPVQVWPETTGTAQCDVDGIFTTATISARCLIKLPDAPIGACRLGLKLTSTDDGGDTGANRESIFASFSGDAR